LGASRREAANFVAWLARAAMEFSGLEKGREQQNTILDVQDLSLHAGSLHSFGKPCYNVCRFADCGWNTATPGS